MYQGRACYLTTDPGQEHYTLQVPVFPDYGASKLPVNQIAGPVLPIGAELKKLAKDDLLDELDAIYERLPEMPIFEILQNFFRQPVEVCPTSLLESYILFLIDAEQASREYHTLPYTGGLWDQPSLLLDCFTQIRYERNQYDRIRMQRMAKKAKKSGVAGSDQSIAHPSTSEALGLPPRTS